MSATKPKNLFRLFKIFVITVLTFTAAGFVLFFYTTSVTNDIDKYIYNLPFKEGTAHRVVQGYGGLFSHKHIAAIDFEMPVGTPVYATREGIVFSYKDNSNEGGFLPKYKNKANYIILQHDDGSYGCYWHLQKNGVLIKSGRVKKGQQIGISGATGQVLRPHLHFSVKLKLNYEKNSFTRTKFQTTKGIQFLKNRRVYERP